LLTDNSKTKKLLLPPMDSNHHYTFQRGESCR